MLHLSSIWLSLKHFVLSLFSHSFFLSLYLYLYLSLSLSLSQSFSLNHSLLVALNLLYLFSFPLPFSSVVCLSVYPNEVYIFRKMRV